MAAYSFPTSPTVGQTVTVGSKSFAWDGTFWNIVTELHTSDWCVLSTGNNTVGQYSIIPWTTKLRGSGDTFNDTSPITHSGLYLRAGRTYSAELNLFGYGISNSAIASWHQYTVGTGATSVITAPKGWWHTASEARAVGGMTILYTPTTDILLQVVMETATSNMVVAFGYLSVNRIY